MSQEFFNTIVGFLASVPIWGLLLFFIYRNIGRRDAFEKEIFSELNLIKVALTGLDKSFALMKKDVEFATNLSKSVSDMSERLSKVKYDVDNYFTKLREVEAKIVR